ncbi:serine/arginine-rich splicing factor SR45-like [Ixodes scapularis]|uniref:serine/arginine-rich splicing factor SR45-like n=1 Tax=Ixodes scapularis TaxID=6945 RepID=UPI001AD7D395|nr:serine/arginine-rich splicing factor SR45-like [Ixodes scapularis]XP_040359635.1 serine/arginine-rich splicing factor SR45-like [Ixodes scapularis]
MVRTVKELFKKSADWPLALLSYRKAPGVTGYSPAQLLMGRSLRTRLPVPTAMLVPGSPVAADFHRRDTAQRRRQRQDFDRRHAAHALRPLGEGERVWIRNANCADTVLSPAQRPRSYVIQTDAGALVRNRRHLVPQQSPATGGCDLSSSGPGPQEFRGPPRSPLRPEPACGSPTPRAASPLPVASPEGSPAAPSRQPASGVRTRSGRCVRPPVRLNL